MNRIHIQRSRSPLPPLPTLHPLGAVAGLRNVRATAETLTSSQSAIRHPISYLKTRVRITPLVRRTTA